MKPVKLMGPFTRHPASVGESYLEHLLVAGGFSIRMIAAGLACLVHAVLPFVFEHTGSNCVARLHERLNARRTVHLTGVLLQPPSRST